MDDQNQYGDYGNYDTGAEYMNYDGNGNADASGNQMNQFSEAMNALGSALDDQGQPGVQDYQPAAISEPGFQTQV